MNLNTPKQEKEFQHALVATELRFFRVREKLRACQIVGLPTSKRSNDVLNQSLNSIQHATESIHTALDQDIEDFRLTKGKK